MLLMTTQDASLMISGRCGGASPDSEDPMLIEVLKYITGKIEAVLNVASLTQGNYTDTAYIDGDKPNRAYFRGPIETRIRLSNGFIVPDTVFVLDSAGNEIDPERYKQVENDKGIVHLTDWCEGTYRVEYASGFPLSPLPDTIPEDFDYDARVLQNIPAWMQGLAVLYLVKWFRVGKLNVNAPKELSYRAVIDALSKEIATQAYGTYQRPRQGCVFADPC